jgi:hypothetical protein
LPASTMLSSSVSFGDRSSCVCCHLFKA